MHLTTCEIDRILENQVERVHENLSNYKKELKYIFGKKIKRKELQYERKTYLNHQSQQ